MDLVFEDKKKRAINIKEEVSFSSFSSFHLIAVTARAKGEKQLSATDDEDLTVEIDGGTFPKLGTEKALVDSPASFSGGKLHDLSETIYFLIFLRGRNHKIILKAEDPPGTATLESLEVYSVNLGSRFDLAPQIRAEDGDRRPWLNFALVDLSLKSFSVSLNLTRRFLDSDDVKVIVDGEVKRNLRNNFRKFWFFISSSLFGEKQGETFATDLPKDLHYLEFSADRMPFFDRVVLDFGSVPLPPQNIPTVTNPKWMGNFYDDTAELLLARLILGEAADQSREAKVWVGGCVLNRVAAGAWPDTIHGVILQPDQYDPFKRGDPNFSRIIDPLNDASEVGVVAWKESYEIATGLISGRIKNPTEATHFHGRGVSKDWFLENIVSKGRYIDTIDDTYFYWSPN